MSETTRVPTADLVSEKQLFHAENQALRELTSRPTAPATSPSIQPTDRRHLSMGLTRTVFAFVLGAASLFGLAALVDVWLLSAINSYGANGSTTLTTLTNIAVFSDGMYVLATLALVIAGILFVIWFNLAYKTARSRGATNNRFGSGWAVGGWFIPFGNLILPKLVMNEIDQMSRTDQPEPIGATWRQNPRLAISAWWWGLWIVSMVLSFVLRVMLAIPSTSFGSITIVSLGFGATKAGAGVLLAITVMTIGRRLK